MVWWLFKKREVHPEHKHLKAKIDSVDFTVKRSFSNVKKDILHLFDKLNKHDEDLQLLKQKLVIFDKIKEKQIEEEEIYEEIPTASEKPPISWEDLTTVQQNLFKRLAILQIEGAQKYIAMKNLAEELYPNKSYNSVRSMISDYVHLLIELGLIKKIRKRRQVYISLSKTGSKFFNKTKQKKLLQVLEKTE